MCNEPATINPNQATMQSILGDAPGILESTEQEDQIDGGHTDFALHQEMSTPLVDRFPFGCPGMPTPNKPQGLSMYETWQATPKDSLWALFHSELDWNVVRWVKMRGPSSTAAMELLAIPGVCVSH